MACLSDMPSTAKYNAGLASCWMATGASLRLGDLIMPASMAGIWLRIADNQEPTRDHSDQVVCNQTDDANRQGQPPSEMMFSQSSAVRKHQRPEQEIVGGFVQMVTGKIAGGWSAYLVTVVFQHIPGPRHVVLNRMTDEVQRIYSTLVTRVHRKPKSAPIDELPVLIAVADLPVFKLDRAKSSSSCNDGLHFHAILMIPTIWPPKTGPRTHRTAPSSES